MSTLDDDMEEDFRHHVKNLPQNTRPKLPYDMQIGYSTFKAGVDLSCFLEAVQRHNKIYKKLLDITPARVTNKIVKDTLF
ncbi:MAG: hypothetical protein OQL19_16605 [Gammaproteobacteria bacterium]|nr:hypothetical protein [Gammaproteobacteria bacterium]